MPVALKKKPRIVEAAPPIPDARLGLFDAIERRKKADRAVEAQHEAISRGRELVDKAEADIEKLEAKIAAADETDVRTAASLVKADKTVAAPWHGDSARIAVTNAKERLRLTERARKQLQDDLAVMQDDAAAAQNAILVEIKKLTAPLVQKVVGDLREAKRKSIIATTVLNELLADDGRRSVRFNDSLRAMKADSAREAPLKEFRAGFEHLQFGQAANDDYTTAVTALDMVKAALLALQTDPLAKLPELPS